MLVYPDVQILDVSGPLEVFARTSRWLADHGRSSGKPAYDVQIVAAQAGGLDRVNIGDGTYTEHVVLVTGVSLYGGYNPADWSRDNPFFVTRLRKSEDTAGKISGKTAL